jgi:hypothetical protein
VYERFEQRQSQAEIVIGLRVEPETVRELFDQYWRGLIDTQLDHKRPNTPQQGDIPTVSTDELARRLAALPQAEPTRISVGRLRDTAIGEDEREYHWLIELGGFIVSGPCEPTEIIRRYGRGSYRVTAYGLEPSGLRWEAIVRDLNG